VEVLILKEFGVWAGAGGGVVVEPVGLPAWFINGWARLWSGWVGFRGIVGGRGWGGGRSGLGRGRGLRLAGGRGGRGGGLLSGVYRWLVRGEFAGCGVGLETGRVRTRRW
jgi:hypothetical protein